MMLDEKIMPEYYCERCNHGWPVLEAPVPAPRELATA
jgi:hypothetical protein